MATQGRAVPAWVLSCCHESSTKPGHVGEVEGVGDREVVCTLGRGLLGGFSGVLVPSGSGLWGAPTGRSASLFRQGSFGEPPQGGMLAPSERGLMRCSHRVG